MADLDRRGGCQCGAIRYAIRGALPSAYCCHCDACKRQSAGAFGFSILIPFAQISVEGALASFQITGDSGAAKDCFFCPECGTRMWHRSVRSPDNVSLKIGTLDDWRGLEPAYHLWISKKMDWVVLDPAIPAYETQPARPTVKQPAAKSG